MCVQQIYNILLYITNKSGLLYDFLFRRAVAISVGYKVNKYKPCVLYNSCTCTLHF